MLEMKIFEKVEFGQVRAVVIDGEPWLVGKDIAVALGYKDTSDALKRHVDCDDKLTRCFTDSGQKREMYIINESGVYALVFGSKLESAGRFRRWVTKEVLPTIRKYGMYAEDELLDNPDLLLKVVTKLKAEREAKKLAEQKVCELETELDRSKDWYSIKRVAALNGVDWKKFDWRKLKRTGEMMGYDVKKIFDANYGTINTYHRDVWEKVYSEYEL